MDGEGGKKFPSQCDLLCKPAEVEQMIQDASSEFRAGGLLEGIACGKQRRTSTRRCCQMSKMAIRQTPYAKPSLDAGIIIANAPDPVFVSDLEGKILQANDAVSQLLGFRQDEVLEQSLSRFISSGETREFTAALREVVERGVTRNARLNPRSASGEVIPTTLNASALRDPYGKVIGAIGILRDMREYEQVVRDLEKSKSELQEKILDLEKFEEVVVGRELKMIALEKELESLRKKSKG